MHAPSFETDMAKVLDADPLTQPIVDAIAGGHDLPDEFLILDTYHDIGEPVAAHRCERIRAEVCDVLNFFGLPMPTTHTMLDKGANT
jgi:hypothetical protein